KDQSGGALPGATVTLSSPSLQLKQITQTTDATGNYQFVDLPLGTYRLKVELSGFTTSVCDELRLSVGFVARVDVSLKVGAMEETVTVSGQSPVIDVTSTTTSVSLTADTLNEIPRCRDLAMIYSTATGMRVSVQPVMDG